MVSYLLEGFVNGPKPAHIGAGSEEDEPQNSHSEIDSSSSATHPCQAANQIHCQSDAVHCKHTENTCSSTHKDSQTGRQADKRQEGPGQPTQTVRTPVVTLSAQRELSLLKMSTSCITNDFSKCRVGRNAYFSSWNYVFFFRI